MVKINWTEQAASDLLDIGRFIAKDSVRYAEITINALRSETRNLKKFPLMGRRVPEIGVNNVRELISGNYRIIYWIKREVQIDILTVHHTSRSFDPEKIKSALD